MGYTQDLSTVPMEDYYNSKKLKPEPRFQINDKNTGIIVGIDVENWEPGE